MCEYSTGIVMNTHLPPKKAETAIKLCRNFIQAARHFKIHRKEAHTKGFSVPPAESPLITDESYQYSMNFQNNTFYISINNIDGTSMATTHGYLLPDNTQFLQHFCSSG